MSAYYQVTVSKSPTARERAKGETMRTVIKKHEYLTDDEAAAIEAKYENKPRYVVQRQWIGSSRG